LKIKIVMVLSLCFMLTLSLDSFADEKAFLKTYADMLSKEIKSNWYISKKFPSDELIAHAYFKSQTDPRNPNILPRKSFITTIGKYKDADGIYHVYFFTVNRERMKSAPPSIDSFKVFKLESDIWIALIKNKIIWFDKINK